MLITIIIIIISSSSSRSRRRGGVGHDQGPERLRSATWWIDMLFGHILCEEFTRLAETRLAQNTSKYLRTIQITLE